MIPGSKDPLEDGMATHSIIFCLENPMDRGAWRTTIHRVAKSQTQLKLVSMHIIFLVLTMLLLEVQAEAILINHRAPKRTGPWRVIRSLGKESGCLTAGPSPDNSSVLLVYMSHIAPLAVSFLRKWHIYAICAIPKNPEKALVTYFPNFGASMTWWRDCLSSPLLLHCVCICVFSCVRLFVTHRLQQARLLCPRNSPARNAGMDCHALLQEIFPTRDRICISCTGRLTLYYWATREAPTLHYAGIN